MESPTYFERDDETKLRNIIIYLKGSDQIPDQFLKIKRTKIKARDNKAPIKP